MSDAASLDFTHDAQRRSWLASANGAGCEFPLQNLPFGEFRSRKIGGVFRGGVALGDCILDLRLLADKKLFANEAALGIAAAGEPRLNAFMGLGPRVQRAVRHALFDALTAGSPLQGAVSDCMIPMQDAEFALPAQIGDYTDFYTSIHHATAVGRLFRPDNPLLPNYKWIPIGYHGRSSSIGVSGQAFARPVGQRLSAGDAVPTLGQSERLDYELELGIFVGSGNLPGERIALDVAEDHIFGMCLLNDWSARDLQAWEYQPLGPFLAKNFATTISPWVVSLQALAPFRTPFGRPAADPQPLPYLQSQANRSSGSIDIRLEAYLQSAAMRARGEMPQRLSCTSFRHSYWSIAQLITHHTVNGCNLRPGDLLGTGTQSGPSLAEAGSLIELTGGGKIPLDLAGEPRTYLQDDDAVTFRAWCERPGFVSIGFGQVTGQVLPCAV